MLYFVVCIVDVFFDLVFFLFCCWIVKVGFEYVVVGYCYEVCIYVVFFVDVYVVYCCVYIVVDFVVWYVFEDFECMLMCVE